MMIKNPCNGVQWKVDDQILLISTRKKKSLFENISPKQLAHLLDELAYDYSRISMRLQQMENETDIHVHEESISFLYHLKLLRDILRKSRL